MLETMLRLQQKLNDDTNGLGWEDGVTNRGKIINWRRCIWLESAELVESYPWKHWKSIDAKPDYENIKIEIVDIWHFVMSEALRLNKIERDGDIKKLSKNISSTKAYQEFLGQNKDILDDIYKQISIVEDFVASIFSKASIEEITSSFFNVARVGDLNINSLYKLYIGKNILNKFRQEHGYKEGTYIKIWKNREDNVVMQEILQNSSNITPKELYEALERKYPNE